MIYYTSAEANFWRVFTIWYGSVIPRCIPQALVSALLGLMFEELQLAGSGRSLIEHPYIVTMLGMVLGYTLVQRSNLAYQRWWEARTSLANLHSRWSEVAMELVEFEHGSKLPDAVHFRVRIVHMISLTYALCMADLRGDWKFTAELDTIRAEDPFGIEPWSAGDSQQPADAAAAVGVAKPVGSAGPSSSRLGWLPAIADGEAKPAVEPAANLSRIGWSTAIADGVSSGATPHLGLRARTATRTNRSNDFQSRMRESGLSFWRFASQSMLYLHDPETFRVLSLSKRFGVIGGVSAEERRSLALSHSRDRPLLVRTWILRLCLERQTRGGLNVPPPIVTRAYQLLSEGAVAYQQARKVGDTPFPFPYVQLVTLLLHAFNVLAPFIISSLVVTPLDYVADADEDATEAVWHGYTLIVTSSFFVVLGYTALNQVSRELEEPFGHGPNHLPLGQLGEEFNTGLVHLLLADAGARIPDDPFIGPDAPSLSEEQRQVRARSRGAPPPARPRSARRCAIRLSLVTPAPRRDARARARSRRRRRAQTRRNQFGKRDAAATYGAEVLAAVEQGVQLHGEHQISTLTPIPIDKSFSQLSILASEVVVNFDDSAAGPRRRDTGGTPERSRRPSQNAHLVDARGAKRRAGSCGALDPRAHQTQSEVDVALTSRDSATALPPQGDDNATR
jgi:hypothetical protein